MKAYVGVIQEVGRWRIKPSPRDTNGLACKEPLRIMRRSVTNARGMPQIFIS